LKPGDLVTTNARMVKRHLYRTPAVRNQCGSFSPGEVMLVIAVVPPEPNEQAIGVALLLNSRSELGWAFTEFVDSV